MTCRFRCGGGKTVQRFATDLIMPSDETPVMLVQCPLCRKSRRRRRSKLFNLTKARSGANRSSTFPTMCMWVIMRIKMKVAVAALSAAAMTSLESFAPLANITPR
jgi:hypothetical protein